MRINIYIIRRIYIYIICKYIHKMYIYTHIIHHDSDLISDVSYCICIHIVSSIIKPATAYTYNIQGISIIKSVSV